MEISENINLKINKMKNTKFRIVEKNGTYRIQLKGKLFGWNNFYENWNLKYGLDEDDFGIIRKQ